MDNRSNNKYFSVLFLFIVIIGAAAVYLKFFKNKENNTIKTENTVFTEERTLKYYNNNLIYVIKQTKDVFEITTQEQVVCFTAPCEPIEVESYKITNAKDKNTLNDILNDVFSGTTEKEISRTDKELSISNINDLKSFLYSGTNDNKEITYRILEAKDDSNYKQEGFSVKKDTDKTIVTISAGAKKDDATQLEISKVELVNNSATIYVKEKIETDKTKITRKSSYPIIQVEFNIRPTNIIVLNEENQKNYSDLDNDIDVKPNIAYKVIGSKDNPEYKTKGYTVESIKNKTTVTIAMGEQNTGGYSVEVSKIKINNDDVTIYVIEKTPGEDEVVTQAFTYPTTTIEFDKISGDIKVINEEDNSSYGALVISNNTIEYKVLDSTYNGKIKTKGYTAEDTSNGYLVTIGMGEQNTGGYKIEVSRVQLVNDEAIIYIKETTPKPGETVTQAFTYPTVQVLFTKKPVKLFVLNEDTLSSYPQIKSEIQQ